MVASPQVPSRPLRITSALARWLFGTLLALCFIVVLLWGVLHAWVIPRIGSYRPALEQWASQTLDLQVRIGQISAESSGLVPSFDLRDIQLLDRQQREVLKLQHVWLAVSPRSLLGLRLEQLVLDAPVLDLRRDAQGVVWVAGVAIDPQSNDDTVARWVLRQPELLVKHGRVSWSDEFHKAPTVSLSNVQVLLRNARWRHDFHAEADLPANWSVAPGPGRLRFDGLFRQPVLTRATANWSLWTGQLYAQIDGADVGELHHHANLPVRVTQGKGSLRWWGDWRRGEWRDATLDVALQKVVVQQMDAAPPVVVSAVKGRMSGHRDANGFDLGTQGLTFTLADGKHWPGGNLSLSWKSVGGQGGDPRSRQAQVQLKADQIDLEALVQLSHMLPLSAQQHQRVQALGLTGWVNQLEVNTRGAVQGQAGWQLPEHYEVQAQVADLHLAAGAVTPQAPGAHVPPLGRPGVAGLQAHLSFTESGGQAQVKVQRGSATFPGLFEDPVIPIASGTARLSWRMAGDGISVDVPELVVNNADAQGRAHGAWRSTPGAVGSERFPGHLTLQGELRSAQVNRVHRYLPLAVPTDARKYLRESIQTGLAPLATFRLQGDLNHFPFADPKLGEFRVEGKARDVRMAYVPSYLTPPSKPGESALAWPALVDGEAEVVVDRQSLTVLAKSARFDGHPKVQVQNTRVRIDDLAHPVVQVTGEAKGDVGDGLAYVNRSPLSGWMAHALMDATASGEGHLKLSLALPIDDLSNSRVQGSVAFTDAGFQIGPYLPPWRKGQGTVSFHDHGMQIQAQGEFLGGATRVEGGTPKPGEARSNAALALPVPTLVFRAQGQVTADGLRQAEPWPALMRLAQHVQGSAGYSASVAVRQGQAEVKVETDAVGMAVDAPAPAGKSADRPMPVRFELQPLWDEATKKPQAHRDVLTVSLGNWARATYLRDTSADAARVLRGAIWAGLKSDEFVPIPHEGVAANVVLNELDIDRWRALWEEPPSVSVATSAASSPNPDAAPPPDGSAAQGKAVAAAATPAWLSYLPNTVALRADSLQVGGYGFQHVVMGGNRVGTLWKANIDANELSGYVEVRQPTEQSHGRVYARLTRLIMVPSTAEQVESMLGAQPAGIPALDIVVDDLELKGKRLGRLEVEAINVASADQARAVQARAGEAGEAAVGVSGMAVPMGREWWLKRLNITTPEARLQASGHWLAEAARQRRTVMNFQLELKDAGALLGRLGMPGVFRAGSGTLGGDATWMGSPMSFNAKTLGGALKVNVQRGQFLKADPGIAKLLGVLSLQSLPRRLTLDFRDVFSDGFTFDKIEGDARIQAGVAVTDNFKMTGVGAEIRLSGEASIVDETQHLRVVVVPEINAGTASLLTTIVNPVVGVGTLLAQWLLRKPLSAATTQEFTIDGSWTEPRIVKVQQGATTPGAPAPTTPTTPPLAPAAVPPVVAPTAPQAATPAAAPAEPPPVDADAGASKKNSGTALGGTQ